MKKPPLFAALLLVMVVSGCASVDLRKEQFSKMAIDQVRLALDLFRMDTGRYPTEEEGLGVLVNHGSGRSPYLTALPHDPWGQPYRYRLPDGQPLVDSAGPDGRYDTPDDVHLFPPSKEAL